MYKQYNNNQTSFTLPVSLSINNNHIVRTIDAFINSIPKDLLYANESRLGQPQYSPAMLLKMLLFAYSRQVFSGRKIQLMAEENLAMKWLIGDMDIVPSYRTINRFRSDPKTKQLIALMFVEFRQSLVDNRIIDDEALFIDGTKIHADANKYSFVWRKSSEKYEASLDTKSRKLYQELIQDKVDIAINEETDPTSVAGLTAAAAALDQEITTLNYEIDQEGTIPGGSERKKRRRYLKHLKHVVDKDFLPRKKKYLQQHETFGDRNSYSKTDPDATFMVMKEDAMLNREMKPGYNVQIATQHQFVLYYGLYQRPTDQRTLIPFLKSMDFKQTPVRNIVAAAGYGSESNYEFILNKLKLRPLIPYGMYRKEQSHKYQTDPSKFQNWWYTIAGDYYTDNHHIQFNYLRDATRTDKYGYQRYYKIYQAKDYGDPERYYYSRTRKDNLRKISVNGKWEWQKEYIREQLASPNGRAIFAKRKIEDEPVFGNLKANLRFRRLSVRGLIPASIEVGLALMTGNMVKLAKVIANFLLSKPNKRKTRQFIRKNHRMNRLVVISAGLKSQPHLF